MKRFIYLLFFIITQATAFHPKPKHRSKRTILHPPRTPPKPSNQHKLSPHPALSIRGGGSVGDVGGSIDRLTNALSSSLDSGPTGVLALWAIATCVITPLTLYRTEYGFSVGYGFGVMALGTAILQRFVSSMSGPSLYLVTSVVFYGARLGLFLTIRNLTVRKERKTSSSPVSKRLVLGLSLSLFYSFMVTPALYAARWGSSSGSSSGGGAGVERPMHLQKLSMAGAIIAWVGVILETLADAQKYVAKIGSGNEKVFVGPTGGTYRICRHPNYLGEIMYWFGLFVGGLPSFFGLTLLESLVPWLCSSLGLYGIYGVIAMATKRLEMKQIEAYGGQVKYDEWRTKVTSALFPFVKDS